MDPRGAQNLLAHLATSIRRTAARRWDGTPRRSCPKPDPRPFSVRGRMGRRSRAYMRALAPVPPGRPDRLRTPGRARFRQARFRHRERPAPRAKREICWAPALVGKAMSELWMARMPTSRSCSRSRSTCVLRAPGPDCSATCSPRFNFARSSPRRTAEPHRPQRWRCAGQMGERRFPRDGQNRTRTPSTMEFLTYRRSGDAERSAGHRGPRDLLGSTAPTRGFPGVAREALTARAVVNAYHAPVGAAAPRDRGILQPVWEGEQPRRIVDRPGRSPRTR